MKEEQLRKILLFYFFVTLDEQRSKDLARKSWLWCQKRKKQDLKMDPDHLVLLSLQEKWNQIKKYKRLGVSQYSLDSGWLFPRGLKLEVWKAFQREASEEELFVTVLTQILQYPIETVVEALGISAGTIRYRLAKATRKIGGYLREHEGL